MSSNRSPAISTASTLSETAVSRQRANASRKALRSRSVMQLDRQAKAVSRCTSEMWMKRNRRLARRELASKVNPDQQGAGRGHLLSIGAQNAGFRHEMSRFGGCRRVGRGAT